MLRWIWLQSKISRTPPPQKTPCFFWGVTLSIFSKSIYPIDLKIFLGNLIQICSSEKNFYDPRNILPPQNILRKSNFLEKWPFLAHFEVFFGIFTNFAHILTNNELSHMKKFQKEFLINFAQKKIFRYPAEYSTVLKRFIYEQ